jgi:WD40 repeat protein
MDLRRICSGILLFCALVATVQALEPLWVYKTYVSGAYSVSLSSNGSAVVAALDRIYIFNGKGEKLWSGYKGNKVAITDDGAYIAAGTDLGLQFIDRTGKILWMDSEWHPVTVISMHGDGRFIGAVGSAVVSLYNSAGVLLGRNSTLAATALAVSPDGLMMVAGTTSSIIGLNQSGFEKWGYESYDNRQMLFSHDGSYVVAVSGNSIFVFNPSGDYLWMYRSGNSITEIAISSDDAYVVAGSQDKKVSFLDKRGGLIWSREIGDPVSCVAISGDGSFIAAGSSLGRDKGIYLFNKKGDLIGTYKAWGWVMDVSLSSDGSYLAAVTDDGNLYYFRTESIASASVPVATVLTTGATPSTTQAPSTTPPTQGIPSITPTMIPSSPQPTKSGWELPIDSVILAGCSLVFIGIRYNKNF